MLFLILLALTVLCLIIIFVRYNLYKYHNSGIPELPNPLPLIGHGFLFLGDNVHLYDMIKSISDFANKNGGAMSMWLGPLKYYCFTDPDDCSTVLNASVDRHYMYRFAKYWLGEGLIVAESQKWHVNKKLLYPMFQQQHLNKFLVVFNKQGRRLVDQLAVHIGKGEFDHEPYTLLVGLETICQTALGSNVGEQIARNQAYVIAINGVMGSIIERFKKIWLHYEPFFKISPLKKRHDEYLKVINELSDELIKNRRAQFDPDTKTMKNDSGEFNPFVDFMIKLSCDNNDMNDKQIQDEINTLVIAGYDTTANGIIYTLMMLGHHQDVQEKIYKELIEVFGDSNKDIDKYDLTKLVYLEAVIKETLRLIPLLPIVARKLPTDLKLKNYTMRAGHNCFISIYGLHRHPDWGPDRDEFKPERWLSPDTLPKNPNLFAPFGMGKRYCVGKTYAMMFLKTTLAHVLRHYRVTADINTLVIQMFIIIKPASGQHLIIEPRKNLKV